MTGQCVWVSKWEKVECGVLTIESSSSRDPSGPTLVYSPYLLEQTALSCSIKLIPISCFCSAQTEYLKLEKQCVFAFWKLM